MKNSSFNRILLTLSLQIYETLYLVKEKLQKAMNLLDMMTNILERMEWDEHFLLARMEHLITIVKFTRRVKYFWLIIVGKLQLGLSSLLGS